MSTPPERATRSGDAWSGRWREIDLALSDLAATLNPAIAAAAPRRPFRALDVGCGAGSTSMAVTWSNSLHPHGSGSAKGQ